MSSISKIQDELEPIYHTLVFQLKTNWRKFFAFAGIAVAIFFLISPFQYELFADYQLPNDILAFYQGGIQFLTLVILFAACFFFGGIICVEYDKETGFIVFPKINRFKLVTGKFLAFLTMLIGVITIYYLMLVLFGFHYYRGPITKQIFISYAISLLYGITIGGFVTLFSSFMKSVNMTIVTTILILLIGYQISEQIVVLINPEFEPLYSLNYVNSLISSTLQQEFPDTRAERYSENTFEDFTFRTWETPTIGGGIMVMLIYLVIELVIASIIFQRRQL